jgi:type II secretory pathway component PulJ
VRATRALTLLEVVFASALGAMLMVLVTWIFVRTTRAWRQMSDLHTAQAGVLAVGARLGHDFRHARPGSVALHTAATGWTLSFQVPDSPTGEPVWSSTGSVQWQAWMEFHYDNGRQQLAFRRTPLALPGGSLQATLPTRPNWPASEKGRLLCSGLEPSLPSWQTAGYLEWRFTCRCESARSESLLRLLTEFYGQE